jgi:ABC-type microcin C transport system permease subunit YejB
MRVRNIFSDLDALLLLLFHIGLGELVEFLIFCVHPSVMLVTGLVANSTLDVRSSHIHICTSCILKLLFFNGLLLLFEGLGFVGWLRSLLGDI